MNSVTVEQQAENTIGEMTRGVDEIVKHIDISMLNDHETKMFNAIMTTIKDVLGDKNTQDSLVLLCKKLNSDVSQYLTDILVSACTYACYNAMTFVQKSIEEKLNVTMEQVNSNFLAIKSDVEVLQGQYKKLPKE